MIFLLFYIFILSLLSASDHVDGEWVTYVKCPKDEKLREMITAKQPGDDFTVRCLDDPPPGNL